MAMPVYTCIECTACSHLNYHSQRRALLYLDSAAQRSLQPCTSRPFCSLYHVTVGSHFPVLPSFSTRVNGSNGVGAFVGTGFGGVGAGVGESVGAGVGDSTT